MGPETQYIWAEKYRPYKLEDLVFPEKEKAKIKTWIENKEIPNLGFFGSIPGNGKTSIMNVITSELDVETLWINGSKDNGIDVMRNDIGGFSKGRSIMGNHKIICIDESDYLTTAAQSTLRSDLELYSKNVRFIFTGNYPEKIIEPLMNRLQSFNLDDIYSKNKKELGLQIFKRLTYVLENEKISYEKKDVLNIISTLYPSTRNMLMFIQKNSLSGKLDFEDINRPDDIFKSLYESMRKRSFKEVKEQVNSIMIPDNFYSFVYKNLDFFKLESQPSVILDLADYQDLSQKAKNKHIPLLAFCVKIISDNSVKFS